MAVPISTHVFRFAGGFSIAELLMPNGSALLNPAPVAPPAPSHAPKTNSSTSGYDAVARWLGGGGAQKRRAVYPTTLEEDMVRYRQGYRWLTVGAAVSLVLCGGNGAILGAAMSAVFSGESGKGRYVGVKTWFNEHS